MMPAWSPISCRCPKPLPMAASGIWPDDRQHRSIHAVGGEQCGRGVQQARAGDDAIGLRRAGRERRAERHVGRALLVPGMHGADGVAVAGERIEEIVIVDAGQRVDRIDAVRGQRRDRGVRGRHLLSGGAAFWVGFSVWS